MTESNRFLDGIDVASPCPASWDAMSGDDKSRFCQECKLNVYNLSGMTADEATHLVQQREGRLCVRFFRREDGTVLTQDCPVGFAALRKKARLAYARVAAFCGLFFTGLIGCARDDGGNENPPPKPKGHILEGDVEMGIVAPWTPDCEIKGEIAPQRVETPPKRALMGKIKAPHQPPQDPEKPQK